MRIHGHLFAFGKPDGEPRPINIPDECVTLKDRLNAGFKYGQNDFQPRPFCSISVNDVLEIEGQYFIVRCCGFDRLTKEEFEECHKMAGKCGQFDGPTEGAL